MIYGRRMLWFGIASAGFSFVCSGCGGNRTDSSSSALQENASIGVSGTDVFEHDAGTVEADFSHKFVADFPAKKTVKSIHSSCGCTVASLKIGDQITKGTPVALNVSPKGESGVVKRIVIVRFDDGTNARFALSYDYKPPPFASPKHIVFRSSEPTKMVHVTFPGEAPPEISDVECQSERISYEITGRDADVLTIAVAYNYEQFQEPEESVIVIKTRPPLGPSIRIPFLALRN